ncbi:uncharacterized protein AMSG_02978 [Thecamonas trahens ATCC 50062]|uniref:Uncharacterized protein n=1 Tax=Thecamonas trahens ATCC 50062 TaxID=461836 RepID=A0A0L0D5E7_THETB|nr:hypothetical protein AMSG_02978 [Thecamonas trahens ATCC 50062]KNC46543.1 hypothetical protein AMSG_02978 [Thecamonas trahens ATCC 50062]|eukprot:XP_013760322.1 hypothetical protein AMSG_02978 [Thecamonas trahens ATCC 50062]
MAIAASASKMYVLMTLRYTPPPPAPAGPANAAKLGVCELDGSACTTVDVVAPIVSPDTAWGTSMAAMVASDGTFFGAFVAGTSNAIFTVVCSDEGCASPTVTQHGAALSTGTNSLALSIGPDGEKLVWFAGANGVRHLDCHEPACSTAIMTTKIIYPTLARGLAIVPRQGSGFPQLTFLTTSLRPGCSNAIDGLATLLCSNATCSTADIFTVADGIGDCGASAPEVGDAVGIASNPTRLTFYNATMGTYRIAECATEQCLGAQLYIVPAPAPVTPAVGIATVSGASSAVFVDAPANGGKGYSVWECASASCTSSTLRGRTTTVAAPAIAASYAVAAASTSTTAVAYAVISDSDVAINLAVLADTTLVSSGTSTTASGTSATSSGASPASSGAVWWQVAAAVGGAIALAHGLA